MKEATYLLQKVRSAALRRLLLDEARRWGGGVLLLLLLLRIAVAFWDESYAIIQIVCLIVLLFYTILRLKILRRRVPSLGQTARRLEERDAKLQGVLSAALEFESSSVDAASDSQSLRNATIDQARRFLERSFAEGRVCALRDIALKRTQDKRQNLLVLCERLGTLCAAFLLVSSFVWPTPSDKTQETTSPKPTTKNETEKTLQTTTSASVENVPLPAQASTSLDDELAFLCESLVRCVSLADSLMRELSDASSDSLDSTLMFQLVRELDSAFSSSSGVVATVAKIQTSLVLLPKQDLAVFLLARRLRDFDEYLNENQNVGAELMRLLATSTRSFSYDVRKEAVETALETLRRTRERLQVEERALLFLTINGEFTRSFKELEQERDALIRDAIKRLQARPGALTDADASDLKTNDFLTRLDAFERKWKEQRDKLEETARRLREPDAKDFVNFVERFVDRTDSYALLLGNERTQVDLSRRFERPLTSIRQIERNARAERWGKVATELGETQSARDMLGADICEKNDYSSTIAWRLAFGTFDGVNSDLEDLPLNDKETEKRERENENDVELTETPSREAIQETLERMARDAELASESERFSFADEAREVERIARSPDALLKSDKTSQEDAAPDENYAGGASARETNAPIENKTDAFSGELPKIAQKRLQAGKRWNPPPEFQEKERAFQARLKEETRKNKDSNNVIERRRASRNNSLRPLP